MSFAISPFHLSDDFPAGMSLEQKIEVFNVRVRVWQLDPAQKLADTVEGSGFAVLHIVMSYFESMAKFRDGYCGKYQSKDYFKKGFNQVFRIEGISEKDLGDMLDGLYDAVRSGLYHASMTGAGVELTGQIDGPLEIFSNDDGVYYFKINPHKIVEPLRGHLFAYLRELRDPANEDLRQKFEVRFDWIQAGQPDNS